MRKHNILCLLSPVNSGYIHSLSTGRRVKSAPKWPFAGKIPTNPLSICVRNRIAAFRRKTCPLQGQLLFNDDRKITTIVGIPYNRDYTKIRTVNMCGVYSPTRLP
jgi:hypothetical protein